VCACVCVCVCVRVRDTPHLAVDRNAPLGTVSTSSHAWQQLGKEKLKKVNVAPTKISAEIVIKMVFIKTRWTKKNAWKSEVRIIEER
jgi:hypothetical protein